MRNLLSTYRRRLTSYEAVLAYSLLGVLGGLASGVVVIAFEYAIAELAALWQVSDGGENFEGLPQWMHFALPAGGALFLGMVYHFLRPEDRETGIVHVLSRMHTHYGVLPLRNAIVQFFGGLVAIVSGNSVDREGPGVHLGAATASLLSRKVRTFVRP